MGKLILRVPERNYVLDAEFDGDSFTAWDRSAFFDNFRDEIDKFESDVFEFVYEEKK